MFLRCDGQERFDGPGQFLLLGEQFQKHRVADFLERSADHPGQDDAQEAALRDLIDDGGGGLLRRIAQHLDVERMEVDAFAVKGIETVVNVQRQGILRFIEAAAQGERDRIAGLREAGGDGEGVVPAGGEKGAAFDAFAEVLADDEDGGAFAGADQGLGVLTGVDELDTDVGGFIEIAQERLGPFVNFNLIEVARHAVVFIEHGYAQAHCRLLAEVLTQGDAEDEDEDQRHRQQDDQGARIAHEQAQVFFRQRPDDHERLDVSRGAVQTFMVIL